MTLTFKVLHFIWAFGDFIVLIPGGTKSRSVHTDDWLRGELIDIVQDFEWRLPIPRSLSLTCISNQVLIILNLKHTTVWFYDLVTWLDIITSIVSISTIITPASIIACSLHSMLRVHRLSCSVSWSILTLWTQLLHYLGRIDGGFLGTGCLAHVYQTVVGILLPSVVPWIFRSIGVHSGCVRHHRLGELTLSLLDDFERQGLSDEIPLVFNSIQHILRLVTNLSLIILVDLMLLIL